MKWLARALVISCLGACGGSSGQDGVSWSTVLLPADSDYQPRACDPLMQTGCNPGEKCTWIRDQANPPMGHVECAPVAAAPRLVGAACMVPPPGPLGYDDCIAGALCIGGICKQICDVAGGLPSCGANRACTRYAEFFDVNGATVAGACDSRCDPLTQERSFSSEPVACGSPLPTMPSVGCFGVDDFRCTPVATSTLSTFDRDPPRTDNIGTPYLNGCAPGFTPFFYEMTGSTAILCSGFCAALEIDDTQPGNNQGNPVALAKMPSDPTAVAGHGVCSAQFKGSSPSSSCRFLYPFLEDDQGMLPTAFAQSALVDTLGICLDDTQFTYDHDMTAQTPNLPFPSCAALPKRSASTTGDADDAADWGCQLRASSMNGDFNSALKQVRAPTSAPTVLVRHRLQ